MRETNSRRDFEGSDGLSLETLRSIKQPLQGIYGGKSRCTITCERLSEVWPDCQTIVVPDVGHYFPAVRPQLLGQLIVDFLDQQSAWKQPAVRSERCQTAEFLEADLDGGGSTPRFDLRINGNDIAEIDIANPKGRS